MHLEENKALDKVLFSKSDSTTLPPIAAYSYPNRNQPQWINLIVSVFAQREVRGWESCRPTINFLILYHLTQEL